MKTVVIAGDFLRVKLSLVLVIFFVFHALPSVCGNSVCRVQSTCGYGKEPAILLSEFYVSWIV